jgi:molybdopterin-guanine dinucleotide biosynthesis protein MobB
LVLAEGTILRAQEIGVLASLGRARVWVIRRPRVAILATGDELIAIDEPLAPGKIRNSNEYSNAALVRRYGGIPVRLGIARDDVEELTAKIREGLAQGVDLFLTSAGVSVGDYDVVKDVLGAEGEMHFWQVRMKPGKPLAFGQSQGVPLLGLPGNPVSAMVSFEQFARPAILKMLGKTRLRKPTVEAILEEDVKSSGRRNFKRAVITRRDGEYYASVTGPQGSGVLTSMVKANGLAIIPEGVRHKRAGERVTVQMLDWPENVACTEPGEVSEGLLVIPIISVVGKSGVGKTTFLEKLIAELKRRGHRVATVKHDVHGFEIDQPGKDSWRLAQAGSDSVVIASPQRLALIKHLDGEMPLGEIAALLTDVDIILTEGYKRGDAPKIEVARRERGGELLCTPDELVAIVSDQPFDLDVPQFGLDDAAGIVDLLKERFLS